MMPRRKLLVPRMVLLVLLPAALLVPSLKHKGAECDQCHQALCEVACSMVAGVCLNTLLLMCTARDLGQQHGPPAQDPPGTLANCGRRLLPELRRGLVLDHLLRGCIVIMGLLRLLHKLVVPEGVVERLGVLSARAPGPCGLLRESSLSATDSLRQHTLLQTSASSG